MTWTDNAACRGMDTNLFYPTPTDPVGPAKAVCQGCPVQADCLTEALADPVAADYGIRGGLTEEERRKIHGLKPRHGRKVQPINHGTPGGYRAHRRRGETACFSCAEAERLRQSHTRPSRANAS